MKLFKPLVILLLMLPVLGCAPLVGDLEAMDTLVTPLAKAHAKALAACTDPICDEAVLTGTVFIQGYSKGLGK